MPLNSIRISKIFNKIKTLKVAIIGDFAVDFYYEINQKTSEYSVETEKEVFWAQNPKTSLGGAGNVSANLATLGIKSIIPFGIIGNDIFGRELINLFDKIGANNSNIFTLNDWNTCTYTKPIENEYEQNRIDFGTNNHCSEALFDTILAALEKQLPDLDLLIINQQFPKPLLTKNRIEKLNAILGKYPNCCVVADLRTNGMAIRNSILKVNTEELAKLLNINHLSEKNIKDCETNITKLSKLVDCKILLTRGEFGIMFYDKNTIYQSDSIQINNEIDTVGAGDTVVAAFATAYKSGATIEEVLEIANLAAAVTIQKLKQTGTARMEEILELKKR